MGLIKGRFYTFSFLVEKFFKNFGSANESQVWDGRRRRKIFQKLGSYIGFLFVLGFISEKFSKNLLWGKYFVGIYDSGAE